MQNFLARNPFDITKATDLSDEEIQLLWVDMPASGGFEALAKPTSPMPMMVLGGKGSGKTHLLRYYSFAVQKLRHSRRLLEGVKKDGFVGVYVRCGGLNYSRFSGKGQSEEVWNSVFAYYVDLWLAYGVLSTIAEVLAQSELEENEHEAFCRSVCSLFTTQEKIECSSLNEILALFDAERKNLDARINNAALTRTLNVEVKATPGRLVFGVPQAVVRHYSQLSDCLVLYVIDEFENLSERQQEYFNSLIREKELPTSVKVGARLYGLKTRRTLSAGEEIKEGSEYEKLELDVNLRKLRTSYTRFAASLCARRLREAGYPAPPDDDSASAESFFGRAFSDISVAEMVRKARNDRPHTEIPHVVKLRKALLQGIKSGFVPGIKSEDQVNEVVRELVLAEDPILEKLNVLLLYRDWAKERNLAISAKNIARSCREFREQKRKDGKYAVACKHWRGDLEAQLLRENDLPQKYCGFDTFVAMSSGFPRHLLVLLKFVFKWALFAEESPFIRGPISIKAQERGVRDAANWYFEDARPSGGEGLEAQDAIGRLGELFRTLRYSDKPSEVSLSTFSVNLSKVSARAREVIEICEKWSLLIRVSRGQKDRNSMRIDGKYQLNPLLAPRWDLPIARRGAIALSPEEANAIFDKKRADDFQCVLKERRDRLMAPLFGRNRSSSSKGDQISIKGL